MKKEDVELWGRIIVGVLSIALYVQATNYSPAISFSLLQRWGMKIDESEALKALSVNLFLEKTDNYVVLPIWLIAEKNQKDLDDKPQPTTANQEQVLDRNCETWGGKHGKLNRAVAAMGLGASITSFSATYWHECRSMSPASSVIVGATTMLICYGIKNFLIDTVAQELRQLIDTNAAVLKSKKD